MFEIWFQLAVVVIACLAIGILLGKRFGGGNVDARVAAEREKMRQEVEAEHKQLAVELHGELSKVRESIIQSAQAYQNVVKSIDEKLAPWQEIQQSLETVSSAGELPYLIVEASSTGDAEDNESKAQGSAEAQDGEEEGPSLQEKAAQLVREDREASRRPLPEEEPQQKNTQEESSGLQAAAADSAQEEEESTLDESTKKAAKQHASEDTAAEPAATTASDQASDATTGDATSGVDAEGKDANGLDAEAAQSEEAPRQQVNQVRE